MISPKRTILFVILSVFFVSTFAETKPSVAIEDKSAVIGTRIDVKPRGEFAQIDVGASNEMVAKLNSKDPAISMAAIKEVKDNANKYLPTTLLVLSQYLYQRGEMRDAFFWYNVAKIRAISDLKKCKDPSAGERVISFFKPVQNAIMLGYANKHVDEAEKILQEVAKWDASQVRKYDQRWPALSGIQAFTETVVAIEPKEKWAEIDVEARKYFLEDGREDLEAGRNLNRS